MTSDLEVCETKGRENVPPHIAPNSPSVPFPREKKKKPKRIPGPFLPLAAVEKASTSLGFEELFLSPLPPPLAFNATLARTDVPSRADCPDPAQLCPWQSLG